MQSAPHITVLGDYSSDMLYKNITKIRGKKIPLDRRIETSGEKRNAAFKVDLRAQAFRLT